MDKKVIVVAKPAVAAATPATATPAPAQVVRTQAGAGPADK
jgi:hypothetical protein